MSKGPGKVERFRDRKDIIEEKRKIKAQKPRSEVKLSKSKA